MKIGYTHGSNTKDHIRNSISFYNGMFQKTSKLDWPAVRQMAVDDFQPVIQEKWPAYLEEMKGRPLLISVAGLFRTHGV